MTGKHAEPRRPLRGPGVAALGAIGSSVIMSAPAATAAVSVPSTDTVLTVRGTGVGVLRPSPFFDDLLFGGAKAEPQLSGAVCGPASGRTCVPVDYPATIAPWSVPVGVANLDRAIDASGEPVIVLGYSQGAIVARAEETLSGGDNGNVAGYILIGNPLRPDGGALGFIPLPASSKPTIDVARAYDPVADFPDDPTNLVALANSAAGIVRHVSYADVNLDDPANTVYTQGDTTYVFVPSDTLPLTDPLRWAGLGRVADSLDVTLKPIVDSAYDRSIPADATPVNPPDDPPPNSVVAHQVDQADSSKADSRRVVTKPDRPLRDSFRVSPVHTQPVSHRKPLQRITDRLTDRLNDRTTK